MNFAIRILLAVLLLVYLDSARAEGGCPPGMIPYRAGADASSCGPMPSNGAASIPTGPMWATRWGAIAVDPSSGVMGAVDSRDSKRAASKDAIAECKARGGNKCKVRLSYHNQCAATVQGRTGANDAGAASVERAVEIGMELCRARGDTDCHVYYQACSMPVRVR